MIMKPGYKMWKRAVSFDSDRTITAVLVPEKHPGNFLEIQY